MTLSEFLGSAWWAANDKARELGWIVRAAGFGQSPRLYGDELQPRYSNGEAIRGMVFKLGGRLPNTETWTLSPGAPETRRGLFLSSPLRLGLVAVFGKHGLDAL